LAGQQRFSVVREGYYLGCKGALLVFDVSRPDTYYNIPNWIAELVENIGDYNPVPLVLVGNKTDLRGEVGTFVSREQAEEYAQELSDWAEMEIPYLESSAKTGLNIELVFNALLGNIQSKQGFNS
jgi:GTPase SAR1 family protein